MYVYQSKSDHPRDYYFSSEYRLKCLLDRMHKKGSCPKYCDRYRKTIIKAHPNEYSEYERSLTKHRKKYDNMTPIEWLDNLII